jgi:hypothetical protein
VGNWQQYQWGSYEQALYKYYENPATLDEYAAQLARVIAIGEPDRQVPPGIYAEYGYVLLLQGKCDEAMTYFEREKRVWPESTRLMDILLNTTTADGARKRD